MTADNYNPKKLTAEVVYDNRVAILSQEAAFSLGLDLRKEIPDDVLPTLVRESEKCLCKKYLYDYIAKYYKTKKGYYAKLLQKGFRPEAATYAIECAERSGYIDDEKFAENYVEVNGAKKGAYRLKKELRAKGISEEIASSAVLSLEVDLDELYSLAKKLTKGDLSLPENRQKLYRKLASRGFSYSDIAAVTERLKNEIPFDDDFPD